VGYYDDAPQMDMPYQGMQPSFLNSMAQPSAPNSRQMFLGGIRNNQNKPGNFLLKGLSGFDGSGGFMGGLGKAAHFLI